jgi:hypothetical protein
MNLYHRPPEGGDANVHLAEMSCGRYDQTMNGAAVEGDENASWGAT